MKEATDLGIGAAVRRELAGRRVDLGKIKFPVKAGGVTLQGELAFVGIDKTVEETAIELKFIESSLRQIAGVKELVFELENWSKSEGGTWESAGQPQSPASGSSAASVTASGDGLYCDECDMVIRFCPCCGKPLAASAKGSVRQRRALPPVKPVIKKKAPGVTPMPASIGPRKETAPLPTTGISTPAFPKTEPVQPPATLTPTTPTRPAAPIPPAKPVEPAAPSIPAAAKPIMPARPAVPATPAAKPVMPPKPEAPAKPAESPAKPAQATTTQTKPVTPTPAATAPAKPVTPAVTPKPAPTTKPVVAVPVRQPAVPAVTENDRENVDAMNFDNLSLGGETEAAEPAVPTPDFMKSDDSGDDLFGSLIDNLSQSGKETSDETIEQHAADQQSQGSVEGVPNINLDSLDSFSSTSADTNEPGLPLDDIDDLLPPMKPEPQIPPPSAPKVAPARPAQAKPAPAANEFADDLADLLPPMKPEAKPAQPAKPTPAARPAPAKPAPVKEPDPFAGIDDTPLPPMKPADEAGGFEDDDTPLPPMRPKTPGGKENKDPFAALFSEADLGLGTGGSGGEGGKDPFASLDLDLDVLEVFPSDDQPAPPAAPAKPAAGGKKPAAGKPAPPADDNPFNIDNIIDLDSPVEEKPKGGKKPAKDPFDLDDFDIGKFKL